MNLKKWPFSKSGRAGRRAGDGGGGGGDGGGDDGDDGRIFPERPSPILHAPRTTYPVRRIPHSVVEREREILYLNAYVM